MAFISLCPQVVTNRFRDEKVNNKKVVFIGPVGSGKTSAIKQLGGSSVVSTEAKASDMTQHIKPTTTVAMDYGLVTLPDGERIHIYGTPGQERFSFMWDILLPSCDGLVLLLDSSRANPLQDLKFFVQKFKKYIEEGKLVIGVTKSDLKESLSLDQYDVALANLGVTSTVQRVDARQHSCVIKLIYALALWPTDVDEAENKPSELQILLSTSA